MQILKKIIVDYDVIMSHEYPYDTHHGMIINRVKFDACISSSFRGVKAVTQNALYINLFFGLSTDFFMSLDVHAVVIFNCCCSSL